MEGELKGTLIEHFRRKLPETAEEWHSKRLIQRDSGDEFEVVAVDLSKDRINLKKVDSSQKITLSISGLKQKLAEDNGPWGFKI
jgi:hypothetical protein